MDDALCTFDNSMPTPNPAGGRPKDWQARNLEETDYSNTIDKISKKRKGSEIQTN